MSAKKIITIFTLSAFLVTNNATIARADSGSELLGTLLGAAGGAAVGSNIGKGKGRIAAIAVGTLLGAGIGNNLGGSGRGYKRHHRHNDYYAPVNNYSYNPYPVNYAQPTYQHIDYTIRNNTYTPVQNVNYISAPAPTERYCREFNQNVYIGGKVKSSYGTACMQADGSWEIQN